jgi:two-component system sensor histidine kinase BaeS
MKLKTRLVWVFGSLLTAVFLLAAWLGYGIGQQKPAGNADALLVLLLILWMLGMTAVYLLSLWSARPLEELAEQVLLENQEVKVQGSGEMRALAEAWNAMALEVSRGSHARNTIVADVAHELRTPLAILRGQLESMLEGKVELSPEQLLPMLDETSRLTRLVQDLQQLSLAKAGALPLHRTWVPFADLLREILSVLELEAESKGIALKFDGDMKEEVYCDRARIKQVLINLIGNAIRYTPEGGQVEVRAMKDGGMVLVTVRDDGPGIPPESLPYLFERFYRVESSRSRQSGGMGLGLAIAKEFAEAHGGTLSVASELGEGTVMTLTLPMFPAS